VAAIFSVVNVCLAVPVTLRVTAFPITGGYGVTSTDLTVPKAPPQSFTDTGYSNSSAFTN